MVDGWIREIEGLPEEDQWDWWEETTYGYAKSWLETTDEMAPSLFQIQQSGRIAQIEYQWYLLRRKELTEIVAALGETPVTELSKDQPDCVRALVSNAATQLGAVNRQTWANEWRYYSEGLERFGLQPRFPIPPSFSGKFPDSVEGIS